MCTKIGATFPGGYITPGKISDLFSLGLNVKKKKNTATLSIKTQAADCSILIITVQYFFYRFYFLTAL